MTDATERPRFVPSTGDETLADDGRFCREEIRPWHEVAIGFLPESKKSTARGFLGIRF